MHPSARSTPTCLVGIQVQGPHQPALHASESKVHTVPHNTVPLNVSQQSSEASMVHLHDKWVPEEDRQVADVSSHFQEA